MQKVENKRDSLKSLMILLGTIFFFAVNHMLTVSISLLISDRGFGLELIGYCTAGMGAMTILVKFFTIKLVNSFKTQLLVLVNLIVLSLPTALFLFFESKTAIVVLRSLFGAPFSLFPIINLVVISKLSKSKEQLVRMTSIIGMAMPISMMLSPMITELLLSRFSYHSVFVAAFTSSILCIALYMSGINTPEFNNPVQTQDTTKEYDQKETRMPVLPIIAFFFLGVVDMLMFPYFPLLAKNQGKTYSLYFSVFAVSMVGFQYLYPIIKLANKARLIIGYIAFGLSVIAARICNISFFPLAILSAILLGMGYSLVETTTNTLVMGKRNSSKAITIQQLSVCLGRTFGPYFISLFSDSINKLLLCFELIAVMQLIPVLLSAFTKEHN